MKGKLPNFLIVGAGKAGTTSLWHHLNQHPEVYMSPVKEPRFFVRERLTELPRYQVLPPIHVVDTWHSYVALFQKVRKEKAIGEASVSYLYHHDMAIREITKYLGSPKIIIILRNPVDRAFSHYNMNLGRMNRKSMPFPSFEDTLAGEEALIRMGEPIYRGLYKTYGFYHDHVKAYMDNFRDCQILLYDDLKNDPSGLIIDVYEFLGIDSSFVPDLRTRYNVSGVPKNKLLFSLLARENILRSSVKPIIRALLPPRQRRAVAERIRSATLRKAEMKPETRQYLLRAYKEDILKLQDLIKRDLSGWLE